MNDKDRLFKLFLIGILAITVLYGVGMTAVILFGNDALGAKMVNVFAGMFAGVLGLGTGYLLGRNGHQ